VAFVQLSVAAFRAQKKGEEISVFIEHYLFGKEKANVTHFARVKYVIKMTLISPLGCS